MSNPSSKIPASPPHPKHLLNRSISEVSPPSLKLHRPHHHHHHTHAHHHPHAALIHRKDKDERDKDGNRVPQSVGPNLQPYVSADGHGRDVTRSEGVTPAGSRDASRRTSMMGTLDGEGGIGGLGGVLREWEKRAVKGGEVKEERERGGLRATELRSSLMNLNALSNNTTRRLDNTYYSVLEKLSILQSTISSLKELANMTRALKTDFKAESEAVVSDVTAQLDTFSGFSEQEKRIGELQERIKKGREKIKVLAGRVDVVKERVEGWERAEGAWQDKTRRRLRIMWILMTIVAAVLLALVVFQYTPARTYGPGVIKGWDASELASRIPDWEKTRNESGTLKREVGERLEGLRNRENEGEPLEEDPRLRVFDEL